MPALAAGGQAGRGRVRSAEDTVRLARRAAPLAWRGAGERALEWYVQHVAKGVPGGAGGRLYVMLDDVQDADYWQGAIERWNAGGRDAKFLVSTSSDVGARGGASGPLAGRMRRQHVMPLSFAEYASLEGIDATERAGARMRGALAEALAGGDAGLFYDAAKSAYSILAPHIDALRACLSVYLVYGGRPGIAMWGDRSRTMAMLADNIQLALYKDVVRVGDVKSPSARDAILPILAWSRRGRSTPAAWQWTLMPTGPLSGDACPARGLAHRVRGAALPGRSWRGIARREARAHTRSWYAHGRAAIGGRPNPLRSGRRGARGLLDHVRPCVAPCRAARCGGGGGRANVLLEERRRRRGGGRRRPHRGEGAAGRVEASDAHKGSDLRGLRRFADRFDTKVGLAVSDSGMGMADDGIVVVPLWLYLLMC